MISSLALFALLPFAPAQNTPAEAGKDATLALANLRTTYGYLGATHPPVGMRLPGDIIFFAFDIRNLKLDENGRAAYSMLVEVLNGKGRPVFKLGPYNSTAQNFLGGNSLPCSAHLEIPVDTEPGVHLFRLTVTDRTTKQQVAFQTKGLVKPFGFGLVQVATYADRDSKVPTSPVAVVGESLYLHFATVGFARDKKTGQPNVDVTLKIIDDKGKPTLAQPLSGSLNKDVAEDTKIVAMQFAITANRAGNFTLELEARDRVAGLTAKTVLPLKVTGPE